MRHHFPVYLLISCIFFISFSANSHKPQDFLNTVSGTKNEGQKIYSHFCVNCHAKKPIISIGAPRVGVEGDWSIRLKQEVDALFKHTDEGLNAMPQRGGCFECSDRQLLLAVIFLVPKQHKKVLINELRDNIKYRK